MDSFHISINWRKGGAASKLKKIFVLAISGKQEALKVISNLPDSANFEDMMYRLYVLEQIQRGQNDRKLGKTTSIEDLKIEVSNW